MSNINPFPHRVLVYGTLKRGFSNNRVMFDNGGDAQLVSRAITREKFYLADGGFPMATRRAASGGLADFAGQIVGEVWAMNGAAFANCDRLEGHPRFYTRQKVKVVLDQGGTSTAWIYLIENQRSLAFGKDWIKPTSEGLLEWERPNHFPRGWEYANA
jgi:gamma-glutamylcyclotransferase (GGCT)/AIG2-like uncharacterized protein YtfP